MLYYQFFISGRAAPVFVFGPLHFVGGMVSQAIATGSVYQAGSVAGGAYQAGSVAAEVHYGY